MTQNPDLDELFGFNEISQAYHRSLIVLSQSDPVCWDPSMEMRQEERALYSGRKLWLHPGNPPGFQSREKIRMYSVGQHMVNLPARTLGTWTNEDREQLLTWN